MSSVDREAAGMSLHSPNPPGGNSKVAYFATTHWSEVLKARPEDPESAVALEALCRNYYYPLYAYVRRRGYLPHDAQDLTQEFFARLLQRPFLSRVGPEKGRFRSFLLASMNNFLANEWDRARAVKRGGRVNIISLDDESTESRYIQEELPDLNAERLFERRWATVLLEGALARLQAESATAGKSLLFDAFKGYLEADPMPGDYQRLAATLGWTQGAVAVAVHRLRARYRELVAEEVAQTLAHPQEIEDEMQRLMAALQ
jgi:RNA polymerase sigma-70 factor (ECF subfamily)